jgi:glycosyltransferase involved in cell wall biosynthesis
MQTLQPDELIISDDGSTDETIRCCEEFAKKAPFQVSINRNKENLGYNKNFARAFSLCTGDIIFICDQDDVWFPNKIEVVAEAFNNNPTVQIIIHDLEYCDAKLNPIGQTKIERIQSFRDPQLKYVTGMATAIRKFFLDLCMPIPNDNAINYDNWLHYCANITNSKLVINNILAYYRRHNSNATGNDILNISEKTTKFYFQSHRIRKKLKNNVADKLNNKLMKTKHKLDWLKKNYWNILHLDLIDEKLIQNHIFQFERKINYYLQRLILYDLSGWNKRKQAVKFYIFGSYSEFYGIKALLKDIIYLDKKR